MTPLELALRGCRNADIEATARLADVLLAAGATKTSRMQDFVARIGKDFEFHRSAFNADRVDATDDALQRLYAMFGVAAAPARLMHDGVAAISVGAGSWQEQHQRLWSMLVPSSGHAATVQGEVVRIAGRIGNELEGNGGINWHADFSRMADALLAHLRAGQALPLPELDEVAAIVAEVKRRGGNSARLCELAVAWVRLNPAPVSLPPPAYRR